MLMCCVQVRLVTPASETSPNTFCDFAGDGVDFTIKLAQCARGGQVVLSETAWEHSKSVLQQHHGAWQVSCR
jgi:hypothetical protein